MIATDVVKLCYTAYSRCRRVLFTTNGGNNSVSSFSVGEDGRLTLLDLKPTGKPVEGRSGTAKSLANSPSRRMLFVVHAFGPDHLRLMSIDREGKLTAPPEPACPKVAGDDTFRAINGTVSSGPSDSWITPDGAYLYQIYGNASKLVGYATHRDGSLTEITSVKTPYNCPQGLAGF